MLGGLSDGKGRPEPIGPLKHTDAYEAWARSRYESTFAEALSSHRVEGEPHPLYRKEAHLLPTSGPSLADVAATTKTFASTSFLLTDARVRDVLKNYVCDDSWEVRSYLSGRADLIGLLESAPAAIRRTYGDCVLQLEILVEPEERWSKLYLVIQTTLSPDEIIARSERFRDEWILPRIDLFGTDFVITEDLV